MNYRRRMRGTTVSQEQIQRLLVVQHPLSWVEWKAKQGETVSNHWERDRYEHGQGGPNRVFIKR